MGFWICGLRFWIDDGNYKGEILVCKKSRLHSGVYFVVIRDLIESKEVFMLQTVEAIIDEKGVLRILDSIDLPKMRRAIVTILNEEPTKEVLDLALKNQKIAVMEQKHAEGYAKHPSKQDEFSEWKSEQVWGKE